MKVSLLMTVAVQTPSGHVRLLKLKFMQYPAIHTNYSLSNCIISNKKDFNRSSDFLVIN